VILSNDRKISTLQPSDEIILKPTGDLVVRRVIELRICRCRQCEDKCLRLASPSYVLCVNCHNNHSQKADPDDFHSEWLGAFSGPRQEVEDDK